MNKDRILNNSLNVIRKYLNEDAPTMNTDPGGTGAPGYTSEANPFGPVAGTSVPKKQQKQTPFFRRRNSVQKRSSS